VSGGSDLYSHRHHSLNDIDAESRLADSRRRIAEKKCRSNSTS
jgi:hypothetical protein